MTARGIQKWGQQCGRCKRERYLTGSDAYRARRRHLKTACERCGFVPEHPVQLHIDHIEPRARGGSWAPENLQTLCANCHALKTQQDFEAFWADGARRA